jgi:hypothetical protein
MIDGLKKKIVKEPDMRVKIYIQAITNFEGLKKVLPLSTETTRNVNPKSLDPDVMNTPVVSYQWRSRIT